MQKIIGIIVYAFIITLLFTIFVNNTEIVQNTLSRVFGQTSFFENGAISARLGTFIQTLSTNFFSILFGNGYGAVPYDDAWMSGITYVLFGTGIMGLSLILISLYYGIQSKNIFIKVVAYVFLFLFITDDALNSYMSVVYLSFLLYSENENRRCKENEINTLCRK